MSTQFIQRIRFMPIIRCAVVVAGLGAGYPAAAALPAPADSRPVIAMQHASWTAEDGAPTGVTGIAQTPDGWLWIGGTTGLYRFDGVRFQRAPGALAPLSSNIAGLGVLGDGALWVAYKFGGVSLMRNGTMRHFRAGEHGTPGGTAAGLGQDGQGRTWFGSSRGLRVLGPDATWQAPPAALAAPEGTVMALLRDRRGNFWVRTAEAVFVLPRHGERFERRRAIRGAGSLAEDPDGSIWTSDMRGDGLYLVDGSAGTDPEAWRSANSVNVFSFDSQGNMWFPNSSGVTRHFPAGGQRSQHMGMAQGLSGRHGFAVLEDREGNVWLSTQNGLDRFRDFRLRPLELPRYLGGARPLAARPGGGVWIEHSFVAAPGKAPVAFGPPSNETDLPTALHAAPDGSLWVGGTGSLRRYRGDRHETVPRPAGVPQRVAAPVYSMASSLDGTLWVSFGRRGLYTLRDGVWLPYGAVAGLARFWPTVMAGDARGRVWFGSTDDGFAVLEGGSVRRAGRDQGLHMGTVLAILPAGEGAWVGGENGLAWFDGKRFTPVTGRGGDPFAGTSGLVFAADGTLWLNGAGGISAIAPDELRRALASPGYRVQFERLDYRDGLLGTASGITPLPSAVRSVDGSLWFSTVGMSVGFDPATLPRNRHAPPVHITAIKAGGREFAPRDGLQLAPHDGTLAIEFTALSYRAPERVRFRYRLEGADRGWHDGERQRVAHYSNLAPGRYRFQVMASNDDGVWNERGAGASFEVLPSLTQTAWFHAACALGGAVGLWLLHRLRLRRSTRKLELQMKERLAERERIARELHDTLLQSVHGLVLKLDAAVQRLRKDERAPIEQALEDARRVLGEGRDRVAGLRGESVTRSGLAGAIAAYGAPLSSESGVAFDVSTLGAARPLDEEICSEVFAIAREAVWNAFVHAHARSVKVSLDYRPDCLVLRIADDGRGMPPEVMEQGGRPGHWGIPGMRERAARIGALALESNAGRGSTWSLSVPFQRTEQGRERILSGMA